jgi:hypothetical protein
MTDGRNKRAKGADNAREAMLGVALVGWLTTAQIGAWVWPRSKPDNAHTNAHKLTTKLVQRGWLLVRQTMTGAKAFILSAAGARQCNEWDGGEICRPGHDLSQLDIGRQSVAVTWLLKQRNAGKVAIGAAGIRNGYVHGHIDEEAIAGCDGLVYDADTTTWTAGLVVRSDSPRLVAKAQRIMQAVDLIQVLGDPVTVKRFSKALGNKLRAEQTR